MGGDSITQAFSNLESLKQMRILNAAYKEFSEKGFEQASTNRIVREAGIGKGMLFYYFKSKKDLYFYLIDAGADYVIKEYFEKIDENQTDLIEKYREVAGLKMKAYIETPYIFNFLGAMYIEKEVELPKELEHKIMEIRRLATIKLYQNIDASLFREDIEPKTVIKLIEWTMEGYSKELTDSYKGQKLSTMDMEPYWNEFYEYLEVLRKIYYK